MAAMNTHAMLPSQGHGGGGSSGGSGVFGVDW